MNEPFKLIANGWAWELVPKRSAEGANCQKYGTEVTKATLEAGTTPASSR